jgi:hypothetical protein
MVRHMFIAGVPATGKTWLGSWLSERGYVHIDAERNGGSDFDVAGLHEVWDDVIATGRADGFVAAADRLGKCVVVNWGFPTCYLYVVSALQSAGVDAWWIHAERTPARAAFIARGGIDPRCFEKQMDDIEREWLLISSVFGRNVVPGLRGVGTQRTPEELWTDMAAAG